MGKKRNADSATLRDRQNLHEFLEQQAQLAVLGENAAQRKLTEAESDMEIKKNGREEIQNVRCMSRNARLNLNDINDDKPVNGQIKLREK